MTEDLVETIFFKNAVLFSIIFLCHVQLHPQIC